MKTRIVMPTEEQWKVLQELGLDQLCINNNSTADEDWEEEEVMILSPEIQVEMQKSGHGRETLQWMNEVIDNFEDIFGESVHIAVPSMEDKPRICIPSAETYSVMWILDQAVEYGHLPPSLIEQEDS